MHRPISIVIPVLNEEVAIQPLLQFFEKEKTKHSFEVIIVDGGSIDRTVEIANSYEFPQLVYSDKVGRAVQMNKGAKKAGSEVLYFLHADCIPPIGFFEHILMFLEKGYDFGYFSYRFDQLFNSLMRYNERGTRKKNIFTGGGDQGLFIRRKVFEEAGGFDEKLPIMEDFELHSRLKRKYKYNIIKMDAIVSSRKYKSNGYWRVQLVNLLVFSAYYLGFSPLFLKNTYRRLLKYD